MAHMSLDYTITTRKSVDESVTDLTASPKEQGFGILSVIDFHNILKEKGS
jgi:uncharacterized protein (DUF302 family)